MFSRTQQPKAKAISVPRCRGTCRGRNVVREKVLRLGLRGCPRFFLAILTSTCNDMSELDYSIENIAPLRGDRVGRYCLPADELLVGGISGLLRSYRLALQRPPLHHKDPPRASGASRFGEKREGQADKDCLGPSFTIERNAQLTTLRRRACARSWPTAHNANKISDADFCRHSTGPRSVVVFIEKAR